MQITNSAYLAVECMAHLTSCTLDRPGKTLWLAQAISRSVSYTEALMARLRKAGLVTAKKGSGGGYILSRSADCITIAEIFKAFDEPRGAGAGLSTKDDPSEISNMEALWDSLRTTVLLFLSGITLAEVASGGADQFRDFHRMRIRVPAERVPGAESRA